MENALLHDADEGSGILLIVVPLLAIAFTLTKLGLLRTEEGASRLAAVLGIGTGAWLMFGHGTFLSVLAGTLLGGLVYLFGRMLLPEFLSNERRPRIGRRAEPVAQDAEVARFGASPTLEATGADHAKPAVPGRTSEYLVLVSDSMGGWTLNGKAVHINPERTALEASPETQPVHEQVERILNDRRPACLRSGGHRPH